MHSLSIIFKSALMVISNFKIEEVRLKASRWFEQSCVSRHSFRSKIFRTKKRVYKDYPTYKMLHAESHSNNLIKESQHWRLFLRPFFIFFCFGTQDQSLSAAVTAAAMKFLQHVFFVLYIKKNAICFPTCRFYQYVLSVPNIRLFLINSTLRLRLNKWCQCP